MVRQTLAFLVLFIVVTLQSARNTRAYLLEVMCGGLCWSHPFLGPRLPEALLGLIIPGGTQHACPRRDLFVPRKTLFSEHGIAKKQLKYIKHATKRAQFIWSIFGGRVVWMRVRVQPAAIQIPSLPKNIKIFSTSH